MVGRTNAGGGGGGLNFQVIGGTTAPNNPKENTIWINTSTAITDWVFSATQPTGITGMVWIYTSTSSTVNFNALKKNTIRVYPISAKQYVGGAWVDKTAKSYQGGEWIDWVAYVYHNGELTSLVTGFSIAVYSGDLSFTDNYIRCIFKNVADGYLGILSSNNTVDVTNFKTITFKGRVAFETVAREKFLVGLTSARNNSFVCSAMLPIVEVGSVSIDISKITGNYYISCSGGNSQDGIEIHEIAFGY